jgi:hypothetical protein
MLCSIIESYGAISNTIEKKRRERKWGIAITLLVDGVTTLFLTDIDKVTHAPSEAQVFCIQRASAMYL